MLFSRTCFKEQDTSFLTRGDSHLQIIISEQVRSKGSIAPAGSSILQHVALCTQLESLFFQAYLDIFQGLAYLGLLHFIYHDYTIYNLTEGHSIGQCIYA